MGAGDHARAPAATSVSAPLARPALQRAALGRGGRHVSSSRSNRGTGRHVNVRP
ncbi:hypothetical protein chiPu_0029414, partial [Chiloscyllium punctatum]|nr:hypothetical protein [Chiloscyllium punctatum]